jgi:hypothetical protein
MVTETDVTLETVRGIKELLLEKVRRDGFIDSEDAKHAAWLMYTAVGELRRLLEEDIKQATEKSRAAVEKLRAELGAER